MTPPDDLSPAPPLPLRIPRWAAHTIGLVAAVLLTYLIWRGYQSPDFLIDLSAAMRLC